MEIKEFNVDMIFYSLDNKYDQNELLDMLVDWAEEKRISIGGTIKEKL